MEDNNSWLKKAIAQGFMMLAALNLKGRPASADLTAVAELWLGILSGRPWQPEQDGIRIQAAFRAIAASSSEWPNPADLIKHLPNSVDMKEYKQDAKGNLVPLANIKEIDLLRDELVLEIAAKARAVQDDLITFKREAMDDIAAFVQLSADRYDVNVGGKKGNISLHSFDGAYRVNLAMQDTLVFDEGLIAAKALIDECINEWTEGSRTELKTLINAAFQVDKEGNISTARVLGLRRLAIKDEKWQRAMDALSDSLQVHTSKQFVRIYERGQDGEYQLMNLDIAKV